MYLLNTYFVGEPRKQDRANRGVTRFSAGSPNRRRRPTCEPSPSMNCAALELIRHRGDRVHARALQDGLQSLLVHRHRYNEESFFVPHAYYSRRERSLQSAQNNPQGGLAVARTLGRIPV